ncbi:MAG: MerR family transcriptional regulator [Candidatus Omnitrophica bacterium]|nr:MerR family transcriptional regulator [Candidatus Omnitrophota bacterium]
MGLISTKDVILKFDLSYQTLNYYTSLGFFQVVQRRGNKRMYDEEEIRSKLKDIFELKNQGYPLQLIMKKLNGESV